MQKNRTNKALGLKPDDVVAKSKIAEIDNLIKQEQSRMAAEEATKNQYKTLISNADNLLNSGNYTGAKTEYQKASQLIPSEQYPKQKITEIDNLIAVQQKQAAEQQAKETAYKTTLSKADDYFSKKQYELAKSEYNKALGVKPNELYPQNKIVEIDQTLARISDAKEKEKKYADAIAEGDRLFNLKNYNEAKVAYNSALAYKQTEAYPKNQITKIDNLLVEAEKIRIAEQEKQQQYDLLISQGDKLFTSQNYIQAKAQFTKALELKPNEQYPKSLIAKIDERLALQAQKKENTAQPQKQESVSDQKPLLAELNFKTDSEKEQYLSELKKKYPSGVTMEVYKEKTKIITRVIVIRLNEAREFREVYFPSWGGHEYTLNGKPITQMFYEDQVKAKDGEYFKKTEF
ncbi:MAG: hypothetical protein HC906_05190 [Bacteroidales bacterium]|nr:hypothetical protein [Bacteroidales bacterium]